MENTTSKQKSSDSQNRINSKFTWHADDITIVQQPKTKQKSKSPKKNKK